MCLQGMMGRMEEQISVDAKTIESALAHCGATLENQNTALISDATRRMIFGPNGFAEYIWFDNREKTAFCTACENDIDSRFHFTHNEAQRCPVCGRFVTAKNMRVSHKKLEQCFYTVEWRKSAIEKDSIVMIGIYCGVDYRHREHAEKTVVPVLLDVFRYGKSAQRFQRSVWGYGKPAGQCKWYLRRDVRSIGYGYFGKPFEVLKSEQNFQSTLVGTPFKSAYDTMLEAEKDKFRCTGERSELISAIARRPWMEYMAKAGFTKLAVTAEGSLPRGMFNTRKKSIREIMKLSPDRYAEIRGKHLDIGTDLLDIIQRGDAGGAKLKLSEAQKISETLCDTWLRKELLHGRKLDRTLARYILRLTPQDARDLRDYWNMARRMGVDLTNPEAYLPRDLKQEHDRLLRIELDRQATEHARAQRARMEKDRQRALSVQEKLDKRLKMLERKYCFEAEGLILRPATSGIELINEGMALNHCVGGYVESYAEGRCDICFLREASEPDKPWRTIEFNPRTGRIFQDRGFHNDRDMHGRSTMTDQLRARLDAFWAAFEQSRQVEAAV